MDTWGGWIFVSMDPDIEPLADYLAPIPEKTAAFEFETMRMAWHNSVVVRCNWKVVVDAFNETYHAYATHRRIQNPIPNRTWAEGRHGALTSPTPATMPDETYDLRSYLPPSEREMLEMAQCMATTAGVEAADRVAQLPDGMTNAQLYEKWLEFQGEIVEAKGGHWPKGMTREFLINTPTTWHIFPNSTYVPEVDGILWHRMRPNGNDPDSCIWDIWSLERKSPKEPVAQREVFPTQEAFKGRNSFIEEDLSNMRAVQLGMSSRGFEGARTNPVQEVTISHFHDTLYKYLFDKP
jgi:phenylpropionate dioxygenase-like ring-hydroxylating dioxygenase large terminal subunit